MKAKSAHRKRDDVCMCALQCVSWAVTWVCRCATAADWCRAPRTNTSAALDSAARRSLLWQRPLATSCAADATTRSNFVRVRARRQQFTSVQFSSLQYSRTQWASLSFPLRTVCPACENQPRAPVCGSDLVTYESRCELERENCLREDRHVIHVLRDGHCPPSRLHTHYITLHCIALHWSVFKFRSTAPLRSERRCSPRTQNPATACSVLRARVAFRTRAASLTARAPAAHRHWHNARARSSRAARRAARRVRRTRTCATCARHAARAAASSRSRTSAPATVRALSSVLLCLHCTRAVAFKFTRHTYTTYVHAMHKSAVWLRVWTLELCTFTHAAYTRRTGPRKVPGKRSTF